jgi:formate hydrogenlyase subunit 6/NADH:ubiquinone oxidoreductase subunit I
MATCVYPRCNACVDACPTNAIDMSMMVPGRWASSRLIVKEACISCGLCEKVCIYDAMIFEEVTPPKYLIDMKKCAYPRCTLCVDHCPMNCLDLTHKSPVFHHDCERCDLCWCICPTGAIDIPDKSIYLSHLGNRGEGPDGPRHRLALAESKGKFRGLVPVDKVGWDSPIATNTNTPRILLDDENGNTIYCNKPCRL